MRSADTETTGIDTQFGSMPFVFTTVRKGEDDPTFYEWDVDPLTRKPAIPPEDVEEIAEILSDSAERVVFQNPKFDLKVLDTIGVWEYLDVYKFWARVEDTLMGGHLLASNEPHDLTSMVLIYLGVNIKAYEDAIDEATKAARRIVKRKDFIEKHGEWRIAKEGLPEMPSAKGSSGKAARGEDKDKLFKFDMWLPRTICRLAPEFLPDWKHLDGRQWTQGDDVGEHPWWTVCSDYANVDSSSTLPLHEVQLIRMRERGLERIYRERMRVLPVAYRMEQNGVSVSAERLNSLSGEFLEESQRLGTICTNIAKSYDYELEMPKGASPNNSLRTFIWDVLKLEKRGQKNLELGSRGAVNPSIDKNVMEHYVATLDDYSKPMTFVKSLMGKRSLDTACTYMAGYTKFWIPLGITNAAGDQLWYNLYSSLNPTGSDTLRWSCSNPNNQNISKRDDYNIRYCFGPAPGREWYSCDASNIELRIPAYEAGEEAMIELFERPDDPPYFGSNHLLFFDILHPDKWDRSDPKGLLIAKKKYAATWYQWTKNGDFAVQYGAVAESGTADRAYHVKGAQAKIEERLSNIKQLSQRCIEFAERCGYVETMPDKTVDPDRGYPLLCTRTRWGRIMPTVPLSYHVQGTAMWWMMKAMIRCQEYLDDVNKKYSKTNNFIRQWRAAEAAMPAVRRQMIDWVQRLGFRIALQVHDELVFDFPRGDTPETNRPIIGEIRRLMRQGGDDIGIPTPVGCEYHDTHWAKGLSV